MSNVEFTCVACNKPSKLTCPTCAKLNIIKSKSSFCSQECFKLNWKSHKIIHDQSEEYAATRIGTNGIAIENDAKYGRILIATKSFNVGDIVLEETPFAVYSKGWPELLIHFSNMSSEDKCKLMDFQHLESPEEANNEEFKKEIESDFNDMMEIESIQQLLNHYEISRITAFKIAMICRINAHRFIGKSEDYKETISAQSKSQSTYPSALFYFASKVQHSCNPNTIYTSKLLNDHLVYYAIKPIEKGESITFSYIDGITLSTSERREQLLHTKDFYCCCDRCLTEPNDDNNESITTASNTILSEFVQIQAQVYSTGLTSCEVNRLTKLAEKAVQLLPRTHFIIINLYMTLSQYNASLAVDYESTRNILYQDKIIKYRLASIEYSLQVIKLVECRHANCHSEEICQISHPVVGHVIHYILWLCMDSIKINKVLPDRVTDYLPFLILNYGPQDNDVKIIKKYLLKKQSSTGIDV